MTISPSARTFHLARNALEAATVWVEFAFVTVVGRVRYAVQNLVSDIQRPNVTTEACAILRVFAFARMDGADSIVRFHFVQSDQTGTNVLAMESAPPKVFVFAARITKARTALFQSVQASQHAEVPVEGTALKACVFVSMVGVAFSASKVDVPDWSPSAMTTASACRMEPVDAILAGKGWPVMYFDVQVNLNVEDMVFAISGCARVTMDGVACRVSPSLAWLLMESHVLATENVQMALVSAIPASLVPSVTLSSALHLMERSAPTLVNVSMAAVFAIQMPLALRVQRSFVQ